MQNVRLKHTMAFGSIYAVDENDCTRCRGVEEVSVMVWCYIHRPGDLHVLKPTETFKGFKAGHTITIPIVVEYWAQFQTDFMPRYVYTYNNVQTPAGKQVSIVLNR